MLRCVRNISAIEWIVIAAVVVVPGSLVCEFAWDEITGRQAAQQGILDAQRDIVAGRLQFRVGGKPRAWFKETATAFKERCAADLIRSHGCCPTAAEWSYDTAYNETMAAAVGGRVRSFRFDEVYNNAVAEGRRRFEARLAAK